MPKRYTPNDNWSQKAVSEGFRARSVYKLQEIDEKFRLIKSGMKILDVGAAPGSWLQYVSGKLKVESGKLDGIVVGLDLQEIEPIEGVDTYVCDITDDAAMKKVMDSYSILDTQYSILFDLIISDLAPKTSGVKDVDQWRSIELSQAVMHIAESYLRPGGICLMKILRGADFDEFLRDLKRNHRDVRTFIATASRDRSREIYVLVKK